MSERKDEISENIYESADIMSFISIWDDEIGPKIVDIYPRFSVGDIEKMATKIFTFYQLFWESPDSEYQKTNFILPLSDLNRKAKILFDSIPNLQIRGNFQPFIIVLLVPDYFEDEQLKVYNEIILRISQDFFKNQNISLQKYFEDLKNIYTLQLYKEPKIEISEYYSYTAAMEDFQAGIKLFQTANYDQAYQILKNVLSKFEQEENKQLIMEVIYILASLFTQKKNFIVAGQYFKRLEDLAIKLEHQKYREISEFMQGFCLFKNEDFIEALKKFEQIDIKSSKFINKLQFFTIYGRILMNQEKFEEALQELKEALTISTEAKQSINIKKQQSQLLYELGVIKYKTAVKKIKALGLKNDEYRTNLKEAIDFFERSEKLLMELKEHKKLSNIFQLIGNIFEILENQEIALEYYEKAYKSAETSKDLLKMVNLFNRIIQKQKKLNFHEKSIIKLRDFLSNIDQYNFIDLYTIAMFHLQLADSLLTTGKNSEGLNELIKSYEILSAFKIPIFEELDLLNRIIQEYSKRKDHDQINYYIEEYKKVSNNLKSVTIEKPKHFSPLGDIKEIWVFSSKSGVELYNYAPETKIDHDLLGGFLTALQQFSLEISQKKLNNMVIGDDRYMIYGEEGYDFFMLGRANDKISIEIVKTILSKIFSRFWKEYSNYIQTFQGNVKHFQGFKDIIESLDLTLTL